jgi:hypothetical protein
MNIAIRLRDGLRSEGWMSFANKKHASRLEQHFERELRLPGAGGGWPDEYASRG